MELAIGYNPLIKKLQVDGYIIYPRFFDDKKALLIRRDYKGYLKKLWSNKDKIQIAIYPDNIDRILPIPRNIRYIVPVHDLSQIEIADKLRENNYNVLLGYASDSRFRNYTIEDFIKHSRYEKWYLGISTKRELTEAVRYGFNYGDITLMLLGKFEQIRDPNYVIRKLKELLRYTRPQGRQTSIYDFLR
ncbi:hypothetical protein STK_13380 [Sulfurisphaera tokodaii str. 7]|uniref:Uncharacterized protein n=1 Tax=Sulfurisphaera tokodaii (strain DSM 16993 / JCM 10545 / NBRC 100140 / 7) TaxID=273063 RepID=Q971M3_SULTO|nr:hypothetical protein [Sulfurisphaera tokodaii]BAB66397.1 hypothetical protein STK_13380 [Sulfurisphaera tokodaii str. 7]